MPVITYPAEISLIDSAAEAHAALRALSKEKMVGFDTETRPSFRKGCVHKVALMQISTMERCFLFRLNKIGICAQLKEFLENPDIVKIGLSVHDDFNVLRRDRTAGIHRSSDLCQRIRYHRYITSEDIWNSIWRTHIQDTTSHQLGSRYPHSRTAGLRIARCLGLSETLHSSARRTLRCIVVAVPP